MKIHLLRALTAALTLALLLTACGQQPDDADGAPPSVQAGALYEDFFAGDVTASANLINAGILPLTFADPADYDALAQGAHLRIDNIRAGMAAGALTLTDTATGKAYPVVCSLTERQQAILLAGGLLNYTKEHAL